jgi:hypothetical protein
LEGYRGVAPAASLISGPQTRRLLHSDQTGPPPDVGALRSLSVHSPVQSLDVTPDQAEALFSDAVVAQRQLCLAVNEGMAKGVYLWLAKGVLPDSAVIAFTRSDDYFFGVLHSSLHELWARRKGTQVREAESGFRYTPTSTFETFPLPWVPANEPAKNPAYRRIAEAAKELNEQRERWLNPQQWIGPVSEAVDKADDFSDVPKPARSLVRWSAIMEAALENENLRERTLTNLYNERPAWLRMAHEKLDRAVLAAYASTDPEGERDEGWAGFWAETGAGVPWPADHEAVESRVNVERQVLANLLRLNAQRKALADEAELAEDKN